MPKKNDRPDHGSAMSSLMPDVSLDEEASGEKNSSRAEEKKNSSEEESTSEEEQKTSTKEESARGGDKAVPNAQVTLSEGEGGDKSGDHENSGENDQSEDETAREDHLDIYPSESPDLSEKLGLLVSTEVEEVLDDAYLSMRMVHGRKAKKSLIVEAALRFILSDYQQKGKLESEISSWLDRVAD